MNARLALGLAGMALVVGTTGCANHTESDWGQLAVPEWATLPVPDAGVVGERAMGALRARTDVAIYNLANIDTPGFKAVVVIGNEHGSGALVTESDFTQANPVCSNRPLDLCLNGPGFFRLSETNGGYAYTRDGRFTRDAEGRIVSLLNGSMRLEPDVCIPIEATGLTIDESGVVSCSIAGDPNPIEIARLTISVFLSPGGLQREGVVFRETVHSGCPTEFELGQGTTLLQNYYEGSNVQPMVERVHIERSRRAMGLWTTEPMDRAMATVEERQRKSGM